MGASLSTLTLRSSKQTTRVTSKCLALTLSKQRLLIQKSYKVRKKEDLVKWPEAVRVKEVFCRALMMSFNLTITRLLGFLETWIDRVHLSQV